MLSSDNIRKAFKKRSDVNDLVVNYDDLHKCIFYIQHQVRQPFCMDKQGRKRGISGCHQLKSLGI